MGTLGYLVDLVGLESVSPPPLMPESTFYFFPILDARHRPVWIHKRVWVG